MIMTKMNGSAAMKWMLAIAGVTAVAAVLVPAANPAAVKDALHTDANDRAATAASTLLKGTSVQGVDVTALDGYHAVEGKILGDQPYLGFNIPAGDAQAVIANLASSGWEEWNVTGPNCAPTHLMQADDGTMKNLCGYTADNGTTLINIQPEDDHLRVDIAP